MPQRGLVPLLQELSNRSVNGLTFVLPQSPESVDYVQELLAEYPGAWLTGHPVSGMAKLNLTVGTTLITVSFETEK